MPQRHPRFVTPGDRVERAARDPFLLRVSLIVAAVVLLVPVALIFRAGNGRGVETGSLPGAAAILEPNATPGSVSSTAASAGAGAVPPTSSETASTVPATAPTTLLEVAQAAVEPTAAATAATTATTPSTTAAAPNCTSTYTVRSGDYWLGIARAHSVTLASLLRQNSATVDTALFPGEAVCLPAGAQAPTTTRAAAPTTRQTTTTRATATTRAPTTTRAPATTAAPPPPANTYSRDEVVAIIRAVWPDDLEDKALAIAERESNFVPTAKNYCCYGLFQIYWNVHKSWLRAMGISSAAQLYDPTTNAYAAYALYQRSGGWGPWGG